MLVRELTGLHPYRRDHVELPNDFLDKVSRRKDVAPGLQPSVDTLGLSFLPKLVAAWPVERFRHPTILAAAFKAAQTL